MYPGSGSGLLSCFCTFPDIIYSVFPVTVFQLLCPEKARRKGCSANINYVLIGVCLHVFLIMFFWTQATFLGSLLLLLPVYSKVRRNWGKAAYNIRLYRPFLSRPQLLVPAGKICPGQLKSQHHLVLKIILSNVSEPTKILNIRFCSPNICLCVSSRTHTVHTHTNPFLLSAIIDTDWHMLIFLEGKHKGLKSLEDSN